MNSKNIKGIAVISIADGAKLGTVTDMYLDPTAKRVVGFAASSGGGLLGTEPEQRLVIGAAEVHAIGPDALTLDDAASATSAALDAESGVLLVDDLTKLKVVSAGGTYIGQVVSADFDEATFALTRIEASPGFFQSNRHVPVDQIMTIGHDVVVVADAVCLPADMSSDTAPPTLETVTAPGVTVQEGRSVIVGAGFGSAETADDEPPDRGPAGRAPGRGSL